MQVSREDKLPQKICDGCSYKLDVAYDFRTITVNAEKQLLTWLGEASAATSNSRHAEEVTQQIKSSETFVKQEAIDPSDLSKEEDDMKSYMFNNKYEEVRIINLNNKFVPFLKLEIRVNIIQNNNCIFYLQLPVDNKTTENDDEPPPKRAKRTAAVKAAIAIDDQESDEDDDDSGEPLTKVSSSLLDYWISNNRVNYVMKNY